MSKIIKTKETFGLVDGYLAEAQEDTVAIPSLVSSASAAEWATFQEKYGVSGSLIGAFNNAWNGKYAVEVVSLDTYAILETGFNTTYMFVNPVAGGDVLVALPSAAAIGEGAVIDVVVVGTFTGEMHDGMFVMSVDGADTIAWNPGGTYSAVNVSTQQTFSKITLMSNGTNGWGVLDGMGYWGEAALADGVWTLTAGYRFDGRLPGGTEDNAVSIDAFGNIKDSGVPVGGGGGSGLLSDVIMPTSGSPTTMDRGDEWFNVSYSTSIISGFDILNVIPDDRQDPMPLTFKVSIAAGDCCLRATSDPNAAITVYHVDGDDVYVTGPIRHVYIDPNGGDPFISDRPMWSSNEDKTYALLYTLSIFDEVAPFVYTLESITVETVSNPVIVGSGTQCTAWGTYTDVVAPIDITSLVVWTSDYLSTFHVSVNATGEAWGETSGGSSLITATMDLIAGSLLITCDAAP
jgi:hypothetical protein